MDCLFALQQSWLEDASSVWYNLYRICLTILSYHKATRIIYCPIDQTEGVKLCKVKEFFSFLVTILSGFQNNNYGLSINASITKFSAGKGMASEKSSNTQDFTGFAGDCLSNIVPQQTASINFSSPIKTNANVMTLQQSQRTISNPQFAPTIGQSFQVQSKNTLSAADAGVGISKNAMAQPLVISSLAGTVSVGESTAQQFIMSTGNQTSYVPQNPQMVQLVTGNVLAGGNIQLQQQNAHQIPTVQQQLRGCSQPLRFALASGVSSQGVSLLQPQVVQRGQSNQLPSVQGNNPSLSPGNPYNGMHPKGTVLSVSNNQGQALFINSVPAITRPILPKTAASPEKQRLLVPLSISANVRPIAPRTSIAGNVNQIKLQPHLFPKVNSQQLLVQGQAQRTVLNSGSTTVPTFVRVIPQGQLLPYFTQVRPRIPPSSPVQASFGEPEVPSSPSSDLTENKAPKKPCNCTKSQCLKLYCDCFANGEFCSDCNCRNCANNIEHENIRSKAIKACLDRNPHAFHPKIGKGRGVTERRHTKGCHCKRSGCLKNYCECYEAKILCSQLCKCTGCKNFEESPERKTLMHLADAAEVRVLQQNAAKTKLELQMQNLQSRGATTGSERTCSSLVEMKTVAKLSDISDSAEFQQMLPFSFITGDVAKATCDCLLSRAEELMHDVHVSEEDAERGIIEEFGRCMSQIIQTSSRTKSGYLT